MSDYGVVAETWDPLPWEWARERLVANKNFWVVTVASGQRPHSLPVWGVWDPEANTFGFSSSPSSARARHLGANASIAVTVDHTVECVSIEGTASPMPDDAVDRFVDLYVAKYAQPGDDGLGDFIRSHAMFEVTPIVGFGVIEREGEFATRATRWRFPAG
jgi:hypothetical protein